jgi:branched-chain amino acid transport system substrate-binding protein
MRTTHLRVFALSASLLAFGGLLLLAGCRQTVTPDNSVPVKRGAAVSTDEYVIGAVFDVNGNGAPLGKPEQQTVQMLEKQINAKGGINGKKVRVVYKDNNSDEKQSLTMMTQLIEEEGVLAIIGPSQTGTTLSGGDAVTAAKVPMVSCAAGVKIVDPVKPYIFKTAQSDVHAVAKVLGYLNSQKITKIGLISVSNAFGDSGKAQLEKQAAAKGITIVAKESFAATDTDMSGQLVKIRTANPQAVVCWGTNPGPAIVAKNMKTLGMKVPLVNSHGIANKKFIELAGPAANGVIFPAGKLIVCDAIPDSDPQKQALLTYTADFKKEYKADPDTFGGHAYDAFMMVVEALKKTGPDREKLRAELESTKGFNGISGVFNFTATDHNGLAEDAFVMVTITDGKWVLVK